MKTRYSSLVGLKKSTMQKSERVMQKANADLNSATMALHLSYQSLENLNSPTSGNISKLIASRVIIDSAREEIDHNKEWIGFAKEQAELAKEQLKLDMIEHEKFKYLEVQEIKKMIKAIKLKESKELDEVALMTHSRK